MRDIFKSKAVFAALLIAAVLFGAMSALAWTKPTSVTVNEKVGSYEMEGKLNHLAHLKNNTFFGEVVSRNEYPSELVKSIDVEYEYNFTPNASGSYEFVGKVVYSTKLNKEDVVLYTDYVFKRVGELKNGKFSERYTLNTTQLNSRISNVSEQLGVKRLDAQLMFVAVVSANSVVEGEKVSEKFVHEVPFVRDVNGLYYFTDMEKDVRKSILKEKEVESYIAGITKTSIARLAFPAAFAILLPPLALSAKSNIKLKRRKLKGIDQYVVEGKPLNIERPVLLRSEEDLKRTFELIDKPIVKFESNAHEVYAIIDDNVAYIYKKKVE